MGEDTPTPDAHHREFETALSSFKACVSHELRSLCQHGHSRRNAIGIILTRICNTTESPLSSEREETPETLAFAKKLSLAPDEALRALVVEKYAAQTMATGKSRVQVLNMFIERIISRRKPPSSNTINSNTSTIALAGPNPLSPPSTSASIEPLVKKEVCQPSVAANAHILSDSAKQAASSSKPMKRPRKATSESTKDAGGDSSSSKQDDLSRQIQKLSGDINEAMRGGDRGKVSLLMRQRDQLQQMRGCLRPRTADVLPHDAEPEPALKRART